jgi:probable F420-dependent oxidoreductase
LAAIGLDLMQSHDILGGGVDAMVEMACLADERGIAEVHISDHVAISRSAVERRGTFPWAFDHPWYEPLTLLAAVAATTERVRLATSVLVAPLRPAALLAKQVATLDTLSHGRVELGLGAGWMVEEFEACGIPFLDRRQLLVEQVAACRALWGHAPAAYVGERITFDGIYSLPFPARGRDLPLQLGLAPSPASVRLMVRLGVGWTAQPTPLAEFAEAVGALRDAAEEAGRPAGKITVKLPVRSSQDPVEGARAYLAAGADVVVVRAAGHAVDATSLRDFLDRVVDFV